MKFKKFSRYLVSFTLVFALAFGWPFTTPQMVAASGTVYVDSTASGKAATLQSDIAAQQVIVNTNQSLYNTYNAVYIYTRTHLSSYPNVLAELRTIDPTKPDSYWQTTYGTTTVAVSTALAKAAQSYQNLINQANLKIAQDKTQLTALNQTSLSVKDISIPTGSTFANSQAFVSATDTAGNAVDLSAITVTGTVNVAVPGTYAVTYSYGSLTNVATITVTPVAVTTVVTYQADTNTTLSPANLVTLNGNLGEAATIPAAPTIAGYTLSNVTYNGNTVNAGDNVTLTQAGNLVYSYMQNPVAATTNVSYISDTNTTLAPTSPVSLSGNVGQSIVVPAAPDIAGYTFSSVTYNGTAATVGSNITLVASANLVYSYTQNPVAATANISYISDTNTTLAPTSPVSLSGNVGQSITVPAAPDIAGYTFSSVTYNGTAATVGSNITLVASASLIYTYTQSAPSVSPITVSSSTPITVPQGFPGSTWDSSVDSSFPYGITFTIQLSSTSTTTAKSHYAWTGGGPEMTFSGIVDTSQLGTQYITATYHSYDGSTVSGSVPVEVVAPAKPTLSITQPSNGITLIQGDTWYNSIVGNLSGTVSDPHSGGLSGQLSMIGVTITGTIDSSKLGTQFITATYNNSSFFGDTVSVQVPVTVITDPGPIYRTVKGQALATAYPSFNTSLEAAMLTEVNAYRAFYGMPALTMTSNATNFAHSNITWTVDPTNSTAGPHAYIAANGGSFIASAGYSSYGEIATYVGSTYPLEAGNVLSSSVTVKDTINFASPTTALNIDFLNKAYNDSTGTVLQQLAYSLVYMYGDDGQPVGYNGTTAATQGTAHKQILLGANWKYVAFGEGVDQYGNVQQVIDFFS